MSSVISRIVYMNSDIAHRNSGGVDPLGVGQNPHPYQLLPPRLTQPSQPAYQSESFILAQRLHPTPSSPHLRLFRTSACETSRTTQGVCGMRTRCVVLWLIRSSFKAWLRYGTDLSMYVWRWRVRHAVLPTGGRAHALSPVDQPLVLC